MSNKDYRHLHRNLPYKQWIESSSRIEVDRYETVDANKNTISYMVAHLIPEYMEYTLDNMLDICTKVAIVRWRHTTREDIKWIISIVPLDKEGYALTLSHICAARGTERTYENIITHCYEGTLHTKSYTWY